MQIFNMSPMQLKGCIAAALFAMLIVFESVSRVSDIRKIRSGQSEDLRKDDTLLKKHNMVQHSRFRIWSEGLLIIAAGLSIIIWVAAMQDYQAYGAFYDSAWRMPDVEDHFMFRSDDTERLQKEYDADPKGFDFEARNAILVKLGCEDCENAEEALKALYETGGYDVIFSNSDIGKAYVEHFGITFVPSVTYSGSVIELRTGSSQYDDGEPVGDSEVDGILDGAGKLEDWMQDADPDHPGTKTGENARWEAEQNRNSEDSEDSDGTD